MNPQLLIMSYKELKVDDLKYGSFLEHNRRIRSEIVTMNKERLRQSSLFKTSL
jgi:hypothetical protein